jgi:hypothetical protein
LFGRQACAGEGSVQSQPPAAVVNDRERR